MGRGNKRHYKGNNKSDDKKRRRENEEKWKAGRGNEGNKLPLENNRLEVFYAAQKFVAPGDDWDCFLASLRTPLPACFRINPDFAFAANLKKQLHDIAGDTVLIDDQPVDAVTQMDWFPTGNAYKLGADRRMIRKSEALEKLHKWMISNTDCGNITRQEAVSMVPPLALDVQPHHKCLDMCAAPGSKTSQLLEIIDRSVHSDPSQQGCVVANDADTDRAYMLVHQCRRLNSPFLVITTHKGQEFPKLTETENIVESSQLFPRYKKGFFDRVLADVPCTGDGTLRKSPHMWMKWLVGGGITLHPLQLSIAQRGFQLLKPGGCMVYSTCSMSPYENEAVVAELLRSNKGLELQDARSLFLPAFKCRPGLSTWFVFDDKVKHRVVDTPSEAVTHADPLIAACIAAGLRYYESPPTEQDTSDFLERKRIRATLFPPTAEEATWMHLERCMRCVPHDQDTGGFFVASFRKRDVVVEVPEPLLVAEVSASEMEPPNETDDTTDIAEVIVQEMYANDETNEDVEADVHGQKEKSEIVEGVEIRAMEVVGEVLEGITSKQDIEKQIISTNENQRQGRGVVSSKGLMDLIPWDEESKNRILDFYGFHEDFCRDSLFVRDDLIEVASKQAKTKTVFYLPKSVRVTLAADLDQRLKIVSAGIRLFERSKVTVGGTDCEYRLIQDGLRVVESHMSSKRKVKVNCQDFCNLLGGGMCSLSTLSNDTVTVLLKMSIGAVVCVYEWTPSDSDPDVRQAWDTSASHRFLAACWKCSGRTVNVMCNKIDVESMKNQMAILGALRPKIFVAKDAGAEAKEPQPEPEILEDDEDMENKKVFESV